MRILHVVPTYYPAVRYGGPIYSVHALCRALVAAGHQVHVITTSVDGPEDSDVPHGRPVCVDGVQVHYFRSRLLRRIYWSADLAKALKSTIIDFDVVHLHSVFLFPTWAGARSAMRARVPYVVSPRGMLDRELIAQRSTAIKRAWIGLIERGNLAHAACIHLTSTEEHRALFDLGLALAPISVIPNGVEAPLSFSSDAISPDVRAVVAQGFDILCFGRISWKKGLDRLIRAMAALPNARVVIAGNNEESIVEKLQGLAQQSGVADRVRFLPRQIDGADKEALFAAARLFALPSVSENFGNVIAEAMIRGLPVVVTERVGAADIVRASGAGLVTGSDQQDFSAALAALLLSEQRLADASTAGVSYTREQLTWNKVARSFEALYGSISRGNRSFRPHRPLEEATSA
jgi:glycosyltransferase involved in cell wall biosynthesis